MASGKYSERWFLWACVTHGALLKGPLLAWMMVRMCIHSAHCSGGDNHATVAWLLLLYSQCQSLTARLKLTAVARQTDSTWKVFKLIDSVSDYRGGGHLPHSSFHCSSSISSGPLALSFFLPTRAGFKISICHFTLSFHHSPITWVMNRSSIPFFCPQADRLLYFMLISSQPTHQAGKLHPGIIKIIIIS